MGTDPIGTPMRADADVEIVNMLNSVATMKP
jgi:hypothetical protein